jgi:hypothetical protein
VSRAGAARALGFALLALTARALVVVLAARHFPPADDGRFYDVIAARIARGLGYTWGWPDGTVTFAANYPVGYPALLAPFYALFGARPVVAMGVNALLGASATFAAVTIAARHAAPRGVAFVGFASALEPALVAYTPALMTEAVAGELLVIALAVATSTTARPATRLIVTGVVAGAVTLIRPELVLLAPCLGAFVPREARSPRTRLAAAAGVTLVALAVCAPWTMRNCVRLDRCAFVSANAGQNLLIGTAREARGSWIGLDRMGVPPACRTVFGEGGKDRCFGQAAVERIGADPFGWLALAPQKLAVTFNYGSAAAHYLSASNPKLVGPRLKFAIGVVEFVSERLLVVLAAVAMARLPGPRARLRRRLALACVALLFAVPVGWLAFVVLVALGVAFGPGIAHYPPVALAVALVLATAFTHVLFFGAGRYALVGVPALALLSGLVWPSPGD